MPAAGSEPGADAWSAEAYAKNARFVADLAGAVFDWLAPAPGERILDIGCGDGALTERIAAAGAEVLGVDGSADMVAAARARGLAAVRADAQALPDLGRFDAVFSNAAMHWMPQADAVVAGVARSLRPGGRFVAEFGGFGNVAAIRTALVAVMGARGVATDLSEIWYFPTVAEHRARLEAAGFAVEEIALVPRPTEIAAGMEAWLTTLATPTLSLLPEAERAPAAAEAVRLLAPALCDAEGRWWADYVRIRFRARLS